MKKVYHLSNCGTCQRIIRDLGLDAKGFVLHDIKQQRILAEELDQLARLAGGYEPLFSRRAIRYKTLGLAGKSLSESDYRQFILEDYTFLKRPVVVWGGKLFAGSEKRTLEALAQAL
jgi:arsenate reductase